MNIRIVGEQLERLVPARIREARWLRPHYPLVGMELRDDAVITVRVAYQRGAYRLGGYGHRGLADGVFRPGLMKTELADPAGLARAVVESLQLAGATGSPRLSLTLPDTVARVFVVDLDELPVSASQATEMIRWRIKKSLPFRAEEARLSWQSLGTSEDGRTQVLVAVAPEASLKPVEDLLAAAGLRVGLIEISTLSLLNALRAAFSPRTAPPPGIDADPETGDVALINATPTFFSVSVLRDGKLLLYRSKPYHVNGVYQGEESLRVMGRELKSTLSYYDEHLLGRGVGATWVRTAGLDAAAVGGVVSDSGYGRVAAIDGASVLPELKGLPDGTIPELLPAVGLALRRVA